MFEQYFQLKENPFAAGHQPRFIYPSREHQEAIAHLRYGVENREPFVLISGEVGTGKTTAIYHALDQLERQATVALITNSALTRVELLEEICLRFNVHLSDATSKPQILAQLERHLRAVHDRGARSALIVDEAQNLGRDLLEEIRLLSNLEQRGDTLLQIYLVGQPELETRLGQPELRQLRQRIAVRYRLRPLDADETEHYIHHRIAVAGGNAWQIFPSDACREVHRLTHGVPREINTVANQALLNAYVEDSPRVEVRHVQMVATEMAFESVVAAPQPGEPPAAVKADAWIPVSTPPPAPAPPDAATPPPVVAAPPSTVTPPDAAAPPPPIEPPEPAQYVVPDSPSAFLSEEPPALMEPPSLHSSLKEASPADFEGAAPAPMREAERPRAKSDLLAALRSELEGKYHVDQAPAAEQPSASSWRGEPSRIESAPPAGIEAAEQSSSQASAPPPADPAPPQDAGEPMVVPASADLPQRLRAKLEEAERTHRGKLEGRPYARAAAWLAALGVVALAASLLWHYFGAQGETHDRTGALVTNPQTTEAVAARVPGPPGHGSTERSAAAPEPKEARPVQDELAAAAGGRYGVQVAAFRTEQKATSVQKTLSRRTGEAGRVLLGADQDWYRVVLGDFASAQEASRAAERLVRAGVVKEALTVNLPPAKGSRTH